MSIQTNTERLIDAGATSDERTYASFMHLSLLAHLITGGVGVVLVLILWLIKKDKSPFLDDHGREAVNFQISLIIYLLLAALLTMCGIGFIMMLAVPMLGVIGMIMAVTAANRGEYFRYPATIRLIH